ncbi:MAG: hypothetical protein ACLGHO_03215 [Gammaproteobacteria bacterium]
MTDRAPWDCHPDLTEDRLQRLARFFADTAIEVASEHKPQNGDDAWSLGCRRNAWWRNRMLEIQKSGDWQWFQIISPTKGFVFAIGSVPVRFYRGHHGRPPNNTLATRSDELRQISLAFGQSELGELKWRFSIETDRYGKPVSVVFAGLKDDGTISCYWPIPFEAEVVSFPASTYTPPVAVDIAAPQVDSPAADETQAG